MQVFWTEYPEKACKLYAEGSLFKPGCYVATVCSTDTTVCFPRLENCSEFDLIRWWKLWRGVLLSPQVPKLGQYWKINCSAVTGVFSAWNLSLYVSENLTHTNDYKSSSDFTEFLEHFHFLLLLLQCDALGRHGWLVDSTVTVSQLQWGQNKEFPCPTKVIIWGKSMIHDVYNPWH